MEETKEQWKVVQGSPNYEVSNLGRVRRAVVTVPSPQANGLRDTKQDWEVEAVFSCSC